MEAARPMIPRQPPEWAPHDRVWIGFPSHPAEWPGVIDAAREEVAAFARAIAAEGKGERVVLVAADKESGKAALALAGPHVDVMVEPFGDIWLRDTGPIIVHGNAVPEARDFDFNGWGGKYRLAGDETIGLRLAQAAHFPVTRREWVFEGGAIDVDGTGLAVTTEQCLLNPNRNPFLSRGDIEARLRADLGLDRILWLGSGLMNDHTDGHVDNLARFVGPARLAVPEPAPGDPNEAVYMDAIARSLRFGLEVVPLPSPGLVRRDETIVPASYMNFYIGNTAIAVPTYGVPNDEAAVAAIGALFPDRTAVGIRADTILVGGGSFHCISQQVPSA